jgi:hypothetical protein
MRLNEQQTKAIADRLGITSPEQPQEVADYLTAWETYAKAVEGYQTQRLSAWQKNSEQIKTNAVAIDKMRTDLKNIYQLGEAVEAFSETTKLATKAWSQAQHEYETAIESEALRPEREFERAKNNFVQALEKEARSLKYKMSRSKHNWRTPDDDPAVIAYNEWNDRSSLISYLVQEARYMSATDEHPIFSEEAVLAQVLENTYRVDETLALLAKAVKTK